MKKLLRISLLFLLSLFLLLHTALHLGRDMTVQWLLDQGADSATIHSLKVNWLTGRIALQGVSIHTPDQPALRLDRLDLDLDYAALLKQRFLITELTLTGTALHLRQQQDGDTRVFFVGPVRIPAAGSEAEEADSEPSGWGFGVADVRISDFSFQATLADQEHLLQLNRGSLDALYTWQELAFTQIMLEGSVNGGDFELDTHSQPLPQTKRSELTIKLKQLPLHSFTAPFVPGLEALVSVDLTLEAEAGEQISLTQKGSIRVEKFRYKQQDLTLGQQRLIWNGDVKAERLADAAQRITVNGQLQGAGLTLAQQQTRVTLDDLNWQGAVTLSGADDLIRRIDQRGQLALRGADIQQPGLALAQQQLSWNGDLQLAMDQQGLNRITLQGDLAGSETALSLPERLQVQLSSLDWHGALEIEPGEQATQIRGEEGKLSLGAWHLQTADQQSILRSDALHLQGVSLALPDSLAVGDLRGSRIQVAPGAERGALAALDLSLQQLQLTPAKQLDIAAIEITDLQVDETLDRDKQPENTGRLLAAIDSLSGSEDAAPEARPAADQEAPMQISIGQLRVAGDSQIRFRDQSTKPAFSTEIALQQLQINRLDTTAQTPAEFLLDLKLNSFTRLNLKGDTNLLAGGEDARWQGELEQLDLPRISPYSIDYTGYYLNSGQLYLTSNGSLQQGQIEGENNIRINRLEVEVADQEQMAKFSKQLSMPLGTAISILQDSDDNIELDVPISGSLDDPDFGLQSVVKLLAGKGLKQAAFSFLTKSLQPYGTLISLAGSALAEGAFVTLQPVGFSPGEAQLSNEGLDYLAKISTMMADRKGMRLNICGQAVQQDQQLIAGQLQLENEAREEPLTAEALAELEQEQLVALAQQRSDAVKAVLLQTLPGDRLFSCFPVPSLDQPETPPQVLLAL